MSNILPIRFMTEEQYQELKLNGEVTSKDGQTTVTDDENALNLTPDTSAYEIENLKAEIAELKDDLGNVKYWRHNIMLYSNDERNVQFSIISKQSEAFSFESFNDYIFDSVNYQQSVSPIIADYAKGYSDNISEKGIAIIKGTMSGIPSCYIIYSTVTQEPNGSETIGEVEMKNLGYILVNISDHVVEVE